MAAKFPRWIGLLVVGVLALGAVGLQRRPGSEALSEDDFIEQFDEVCLDASAELDDLDTPEDNEELAETAEEAIEIANTHLEDLREITPPEDLADDVDELLEVIEDRIASTRTCRRRPRTTTTTPSGT